MKISIAADHAGYELKQILVSFLESLGHVVLDLGTHSTTPVDYPDYAEAVALAVRNQEADRGMLICGSGVGASVAANKVPGIRAGLCHDSYSAHQGVEHDNMNVLVFGSRVVGPELAKDLAAIYLKANFTGESRHLRRLAKVQGMEERYGNAAKAGA